MTDMIAAEPAHRPPDPRAPGERRRARRRPSRRPIATAARAGRADHRHRLRHLRARGARRGRDPARGRRGRPACRVPGPVAAQAFELSLDPPADGLVIGVSHEGGDDRDERGPRGGPRRPARGRPSSPSVAPVAGRGRSPTSSSRPTSSTRAGATPSATSSPMLAAAAVGAHLSGRPLDGDDGGRDPARGGLARRDRRRADRRPVSPTPRTCIVDRVRRRSAGRPRARPQGRGGVLAAVGLPRPRDVPARPPAGDRPRDGPRR